MVMKMNEKENEFTTGCFNSTVKAVINLNKYGSEEYFHEVLYRLDNWINEASAWTIQYLNGFYNNISVYNPLSGSSYVKLPDILKNSMSG